MCLFLLHAACTCVSRLYRLASAADVCQTQWGMPLSCWSLQLPSWGVQLSLWLLPTSHSLSRGPRTAFGQPAADVATGGSLLVLQLQQRCYQPTKIEKSQVSAKTC